MTLPYILLCSVAALAAMFNLVAEYSRVLMMMQQNSYRPERYMRWLRQSGDTTSYPRLVGMLVFFGSVAIFSVAVWGLVLVALFGAGSAIMLFNRKYKKPIVWTARVKRIFGVMAVMSALIAGGVFCWGYFATGDQVSAGLFYAIVALQGLYCASHVVVLSAVWMLNPVESAINRKYYNEAADILRQMRGLKVVGITGSYGKTSTKHYLYSILSEQFETLMTPGSYNTTLGVIRTVREMMKPYCEVFICEMGAKQNGDIKEICDLVHPDMGVVTAVGPQHLESFKTIENVQSTKFELVDALPSDGLAVVNDDFPYVASRKVDNVECVRYGINADSADFRAKDIRYGVNGTDFIVEGPGMKPLAFHTRLVGECNVSNLLAAIIVAFRLGVSVEKIQRAVNRIEAVEHRLSMRHTPGGLTIIDDAFNSNPTGSSMALDVLASMGGRRIIITPGMIELGSEQYNLNREFGAKIARSADVAIVVGEYNREAITDGIRSVSGSGIEIIEAPAFADAQRILTGMARRGDTVLYENDLPDTFK